MEEIRQNSTFSIHLFIFRHFRVCFFKSFQRFTILKDLIHGLSGIDCYLSSPLNWFLISGQDLELLPGAN